jgi:hypothetical protein
LLEIIDNIPPGIAVAAAIQRVYGRRFHDLRHSYAVYLIGKGMSLDWVAQSLGNSRDVCERFYKSHILQDDSIRLMRMMLLKADETAANPGSATEDKDKQNGSKEVGRSTKATEEREAVACSLD